MVTFAFFCTILFLVAVLLRRVYFCIPAKELKRLARAGDPVGAQLYRPVAYGAAFSLLLWVIIVAFAAASVILWAHGLPAILSVPLVFVILLVGFGWGASAFPHARTVEVAARLASFFTWILMRTQPVSSRLGSFIRSRRNAYMHTGLYEKEDFAEVLAMQKEQQDNRMHSQDITLMERALRFGDQTATAILTPRKTLRLVNAHDTIGPILLGELHDSGATTFLVYEGKKDHIIGSVRLLDLIQAKQGGQVRSFVQSHIIYVRDDFSLPQILNAFQQTGQQVVSVINNHREFLGIVRFEDLLGTLTGDVPDEAIAYDDPRAVAEYQPKQPEPEPTREQSDEAVEAQGSEQGHAELAAEPVPDDDSDTTDHTQAV